MYILEIEKLEFVFKVDGKLIETVAKYKNLILDDHFKVFTNTNIRTMGNNMKQNYLQIHESLL